MKPKTEELYQQALDLGEEERVALVALLIESLEGEAEPSIQQDWRAEIERRMMELDSGSVEAVPWEDVRAHLLGLDDSDPAYTSP